MVKITCPVCDRPEIDGEVCPNCETDLSSVKILLELPTSSQFQPGVFVKKWLRLPSLAILLFIVGIILGGTGNYLLSQQQLMTQSSAKLIPSPTLQQQPKQVKTSLNSPCGAGFYYTVRSGDSLSLLASRFYGNEKNLLFITKANYQLKNRENYLKRGEKLLIPNKLENCQ